MVDILDEAREEIRKEQLENKFKSLAGYFIAIAIIAVAGVAGYKFFQHQQITKIEKQGGLFTQGVVALINQNKSDALNKFTELSNQDGSYAVMASLRRAALLLEQGKIDEAISTYQAIINSPKNAKEFKDLASVNLAYVYFEANKDDELVKLLDANQNNIFSPQLNELRAIRNIKLGNKQAALEILQKLEQDPTTPAATKERIKELIKAIS